MGRARRTTVTPKATPKQRSPLQTARGDDVDVVHFVAEYGSFARTGGLAEAVSSLSRYQAATGIRTTAIMPLYRPIRQQGHVLEPLGEPFGVQLGPRYHGAQLYRLGAGARGPSLVFVDNREFFDRERIYGEAGSDYPDNAQRFAFFSLAALSALPDLVQGPTVLHAHDWHAALAPLYLRTTFAADERFDRVSAVLSVHNAGYQGHFPPAILAELGIPFSLYNFRVLEWYNRVNLLKGGLYYADAVTTVSRTHADELRTPDGGFGLHDTFRSLGDRLTGITNGIDHTAWDPSNDAHTVERYSAADLSGKARCKAYLQQRVGFPQNPRTPLFAMSARLVAQKGIDLILRSQVLTASDAQFVFLGQGEPRFVQSLREAAAAAPHRVHVDTNFNDPAEHVLIAGADLLLMPCQYEPCGLTQMRAQRYGVIPVARRTGGLADTITDGVTGFLFEEYDTAAFLGAIARAMRHYGNPAAWRALMLAGMARDFSWERSEQMYLDVYRRVLAAAPLRA